MRRFRLLFPVVLAALGLSGCGGGGGAIAIQLEPRNGSGVTGVARLATGGDGGRLTLRLDGGAERSGLRAGVYRGPCLELPTEPLTQTVPLHGAEATLRVGASPRAHGDRAVAVKRNGVLVACGDVPGGAPRG